MENSYVYCLRFRSSQFYVGSSTDPKKRFINHKKSCLSKKPANKFMSNVWKKFGEPELYILSKVPTELLQQEEQKFIDLVFGKEGCLNLNPFADRPPNWKGKKHKPETIAKMCAALKGKKCSAEHKAKLSAVLKGKVISAEHKKTLSNFQRNNSPRAKTVIGTKGNEIIEFRSVRQAAEFIGRDHKGIVRAIKGDGQTTCGGYYWCYADDKF